jgi:hypothetical protein
MRLQIAAFGLAAAALGGAAPVLAQGPYGIAGGAGSLVSVSLEVDGRAAPLYPAPDGSGRYYAEAWRGARYAVRLANRTGERLGVLLRVDGLNAISGERSPAGSGAPGRMYVLYPWDDTLVQGWRTSLDEVRQFTFVDEERSYAARSGKANARLGWIEVEVFRERRPVARPWPYWQRPDDGRQGEEQRDEAREPEAKTKDEGASSARDGVAERAPAPPAAAAPAYPGTGWGPRAEDPVRVVSFDPEPTPAERVTLRYEYASALRALGILPRQWWARDRLGERERGQEGFAKPPVY